MQDGIRYSKHSSVCVVWSTTKATISHFLHNLIVSLSRVVETHSLLGVMNFGYYIRQPIQAHCALENALSTSQLM